MESASDPFRLSDALVDDLAELRPVNATFYGVHGNDHRWDDFSPDGVARVASRLAAWRTRLTALPKQTDRWGALAVHVMTDWLDRELAAIEHREHLVDLNSIASPFQHARMVFDSMSAASATDWRNIAARLESLETAFVSYRASLEAGLASNDLVAARQVRAAVAQGRVHASEQSFFRGLPAAIAASGIDDPALVARVAAAVPGACAAYAALTHWLETVYLPRAKSSDGVGRERYVHAMRRHLGASPDPDETYAWGWTEVARVLDEMRRLASVIAPGKSLREVHALLNSDPARAQPDRTRFIAAMTARQQHALEHLADRHFEIPASIRRLDVKLAPPGGHLGAYYVPPSEDFTRAGTVWYALHGDGPFPLYGQISTSYHEGFPGHHLQCGLQVSLTRNLCRLHRVAADCSGYAEGWALYAEQLMRELGFYEKPEYEFGMLANQLIRACRVVFDIGAHLGLAIPESAPFHPGEAWTFDLGVEMMQTLGGLPPERAASETTRYLGWPAQAISYKVGERTMLALRREYLARGGTLKSFHTRVLECGNLGLDRLRTQLLE